MVVAERRVQARLIGVRYDCDECGEEVEFTGTCLPVAPPTYQHRCQNGHTKNLPRTYPGHGVLITDEPLDFEPVVRNSPGNPVHPTDVPCGHCKAAFGEGCAGCSSGYHPARWVLRDETQIALDALSNPPGGAP